MVDDGAQKFQGLRRQERGAGLTGRWRAWARSFRAAANHAGENRGVDSRACAPSAELASRRRRRHPGVVSETPVGQDYASSLGPGDDILTWTSRPTVLTACRIALGARTAAFKAHLKSLSSTPLPAPRDRPPISIDARAAHSTWAACHGFKIGPSPAWLASKFSRRFAADQQRRRRDELHTHGYGPAAACVFDGSPGRSEIHEVRSWAKL